MQREPGIYFGMPRAEYDAIEADNWSSLKRINRSPRHYKWAADEEVDEDTDAKKFGRAGHVAILEPERFVEECVTWGGGRRAGKEWDAFCAEHAGNEILTESEFRRITAIRVSVTEHEFLLPYLTGGAAEVTLVWDTEVVPGFKVRCKGRLDYVTDGALVDVKLTRNASPTGFGRQVVDMDYLGQAAFYRDGYAALTGQRLPFVFVPVEHSAPYCAAAYPVSDAQLSLGRDLYMRLLGTLSACRMTDRWPGYAMAPLPLELPRWWRREAEESLSAEQTGEASNG